jgi:hypothetical protein
MIVASGLGMRVATEQYNNFNALNELKPSVHKNKTYRVTRG